MPFLSQVGYAMHSNELQTGYREYRGAGGREERGKTGDTELADGIKTNAREYDERDGKKNGRRDERTTGGRL